MCNMVLGEACRALYTQLIEVFHEIGCALDKGQETDIGPAVRTCYFALQILIRDCRQILCKEMQLPYF